MREYQDVERQVVTRRECVKVQCDMCGAVAEHPQQPLPFEFGVVGGVLGHFTHAWTIDGDVENDGFDLCDNCSRLVIKFIRTSRFQEQQHGE